jgi:hypothetical protein
MSSPPALLGDRNEARRTVLTVLDALTNVLGARQDAFCATSWVISA